MNTVTVDIPYIPGYTIVEQISVGSRTNIYRALDEEQQPVLIKVLRHKHPNLAELVHFRNQFTIAHFLNHSAIARPLALERCGNGYALVMPDEGYVSLSIYWQQYGYANASQAICISTVLAIAIQFADALHYLAEQRIIHKDIKPANILIHPETRQIQLDNFSLATRLPKEHQQLSNPRILEGTLAYISPEQTGRMNRGIDYRADFYSLGVTLFELLTGDLPFVTDEPITLVHHHISRPAEFPAAQQELIPEVLRAIVLKLMAKNAENRYQSALGLRHDLEQCLQQWETTGWIAAFDLGQRDVCDRFLIPEKLYGRDAEVQLLLESFDRVAEGASEFMLVAGFSGIGKTALVNEIYKPITRQNGYFIKGKFDQFNRSVPFSAFVQAFRSLMGQLLSESDAELQAWKTQILAALGENAQVIVELIPELEGIIGSQPPAPEVSGTAAQHRFHLLFQQFIHVFTTPTHPLVIFLDDLQWVDAASLDLIRVLMADVEAGYLLLLGAYRDNEVFVAHPLMLMIGRLEDDGASIQTINLQPLSFSSLNYLIADTLHVPEHAVQPLTERLMQKTHGNPFFAIQFLKVLHQDQLIKFDYNSGYWHCDMVQIRNATLTDDVVEFIALQLQKLPQATQDLLKLAACIGAQFDLEMLAIVARQSCVEVASALWDALQEDLVLPQSNIYKFYLAEEDALQNDSQVTLNYRFLHDRVQQAAYSLIPEEQKQIFHLSIGRHLLYHTPQEQQEKYLFDLVNQFNMGRALIMDAAEQETVLQLNLKAGYRAIATTAYDTAVHCLYAARMLLRAESWQTQYELAIACYVGAVEAAYLTRDFYQMDAFADIVMHQAKTLLDTVKVYEVKIDAYTSQGAFKEALSTGLAFLHAFGIEFPRQPNEQDVADSLAETQRLLAGRSPRELLALPAMTSTEAQAILRILVQIATPAYIGSPAIYPLICCKQVQVSLTYGNIPASSFGYTVYGLLLGSVVGDLETGYEFGQLALQLLEHLNSKKYTAQALLLTGLFTEHWKTHAASTLQPLQDAYPAALQVGDLTYGGYAANTYIVHAYFVGTELAEIERACRTYSTAIEKIQQQSALYYLQIYYQAVINLLGQSPQPLQLVGDIFDERRTLDTLVHLNDQTGLWYFHVCKASLSILFADYDQTLVHCQHAECHAEGGLGMLSVPILLLYKALACCAKLSDTIHLPELPERETLWASVAQGKRKLHEWAIQAPMNCQHRYDLICAEEQRVLGHPEQALDLYDRAIAGAKENGYVQEEALANELAARFYLDWGKEKIAQVYLLEAYYGYLNWGAKAKTDDLEQRYPKLLQPILQPTTSSVNLFDTLSAIAPPNLPIHTTDASNTKESANLNTALDFASVLQSSQAILNEIQLDALLQRLMQVMLQSSGGDRCVLVLPNSAGLWQVRAIATLEAIELCNTPLEDNPHIPIRLIQYVKNTQDVVAIDDLKTDLPIIDAYLTQQQPKSLLALPILNQGRLIGILQLSNQSTSGVFPCDRILTLNFLCTQAAIALEKAYLYRRLETYSQTLEDRVAKRTTALQNQKERLQLALSAANQGFFDVDMRTGEAVVSPEYALMLGYDPATFHETDVSWRARLHPDDYEPTSQAFRAYAAGQTAQYKAEFRQRTQQGTWKWILAMGKFIAWDDTGRPTRFLGTHTDIDDRKFAEVQLEAQNRLLAKIAQGHPLADVLSCLIDTVEQNLNGVFCSVLLLDKDNRLRGCAAPSLPEPYSQALDGILIGEGVGSCGTAAFRNEVVIVADIATDSLWCPYADLALSYGLRACWSSPIIGGGGEVLGTFAMYYKEVRSPQPHELNVITQMARIAGIAIERQRAEAELRRSEATLLRAQKVAHVGNWEFDVASQGITWSPEMFRIYGLESAPSAPSFPEYLQLLPLKDRSRLQQCIEQAITEGKSYTIECSRVQADGTPCHYECRAEVEQNEQGQVVRLFGTTLDITARKQTELILQNLIAGTATTTSQDFFPALVQHIAQALDISHAIITEKLGEQLQTLAFWSNGCLMPPQTYPLARTPCERVFQSGEFYCDGNVQQMFPEDPDLVALNADSYMGIALPSTQGEVIGHLCILHQKPIANTQQAKQILKIFGARAAAELERQQADVVIRQQSAAIEAAVDGIGILKEDTYLYVNQAHVELLGYKQASELVGKTWRLMYSPNEVKRFEQEVLPILERDRTWQGEATATRKDGSTFAQSVSLSLTEDGLLICVCQDISDRKQVEALITHNALHDPLTDLPNRTLLLERLDLAIQRAKRTENYRYGVLFLDLDRFKVINDSLGHVVGDKLLVAIAQRLKTHLREIDLVARLGGDEFLILLEDISSTEEVAQVAERILADCQTSVTIDDHQIFTSMSIGIVLGKDSYQQATDLIRDADIAMYRAKIHASNSYKFFDTAMHTEALHRLTLETDLRQALDQEALTILYQPIVDLSNQRLVGVEALVRWEHPTRGLLAPNEFIPVAEETGLISQIDSWVLHQACQQLANWQHQFTNDTALRVSVNLSAQDLHKTNLIAEIDQLLAKTGLRGHAITLEITESMLIKDIDAIISLLVELTSRQIQISIDDFGTGYSSLNYLHRLPVHNLKIDRSFVSQMQSESRNHKVVNTIITLSQQLGLMAIAEGIETLEQLEQLQQLGCQWGQGYLFSEPLPAHEIETWFFQGKDAPKL